MGIRPFDGVNVLDFTWAGAGPLTVNYLAQYGATVVKVESSSRPDLTRTVPPYKDGVPGLENSVYFAACNGAKKLDISLNLNNPRGEELVKRLVSWADVVVENFTPGTLEKWGLGYDNLKGINPGIILLRASGYGQTGPLARQPVLGYHLTPVSGLNTFTGWPDRPPTQMHGAYTDLIVPLFAAIALVAALDYKHRTGNGQCLELSQQEACIHFIGPLVLDAAVNHREPDRTGNRVPDAAPHNVYRCQGNERWCAIAVFSDLEWEAFCRVIGKPKLVGDPRFSSILARKRNEDGLDELVERWTSQRSPEEVMNLMQANGVGAGIVANAQGHAEDPQLKHYRFFQQVEHPTLGKCGFYHRSGFVLSQAECEVSRPPLLGEHTEYVCTELLGMSDEEFVGLVGEGVFN